jgi:Flp pilus assembly protein TadG
MKRLTAKRNYLAAGKLNVMRCHSAMHQQKSDLSPKHFHYRGIALAWTAIVITVILLLVGLSLDTAKLCYNVHQMQNATDAASLAGAQIVKISPFDDTRQFTHDLGLANKAEHINVYLRKDPPYVQDEPFTGDEYAFDILIGRWVRYNRTFVPTLDAPNAVQAIAHRNASMGAVGPAIKYVFGPLAGVPTGDASTLAVAWSYNSGGAGLICLNPYVEPGLQIGGNADIDVDGGGIHVNSTAAGHNSSDGSWVQLGASIDAGFINTVGGIDPPPDDGNWEDIFADAGSVGFSVCDESTIPNPEIIEDPLAANMVGDPLVTFNPNKLPDLVYDHLIPELIGTSIPEVTQTLEGTPITGTITSSCSLGPGYYPHGLKISNEVDITLVPTTGTENGIGTIFVFGGGTGQPHSLGSGITMTGGSFTGHGVTCYVTYSSTDVCGTVDITGGALDLYSPGDWENEINPPATEEIYLSRVRGRNGVAIWQDPLMVDSKGDAPDGHLRGNGDFSIKGTVYFPDPIHIRLEGDLGNTGNQILCGSAKIEGTAVITVDYDKRNQGEASSVCLVK